MRSQTGLRPVMFLAIWIYRRRPLPSMSRGFRCPVCVLLLIATVPFFGGTGCESPRNYAGARSDLLAFLQNGVTTRADAVLQLGTPTATLEQEKIITFRIGQDPKQGYYVVSPRQASPWQSVRYSLVLVFNAEGVLQRHRLVLVE